MKKLQTDHVDLFFCHAVSATNDIGEPVREWAAQMKKAGKMKFFGFSTHTNMEDCLLAAAKLDWIDVVMFSYNFRLMLSPKMKEAVAACTDAGIGLVAMKTQGSGPAKAESEAEVQMVGKIPRTRLHRQAGQTQGGVGKPEYCQHLFPDAEPEHPFG